MKRIIFLVLLVCLWCPISWAGGAPYVNEEYGFTVNIPDGFKVAPMEGKTTLGAYTNDKIFFYVRYILPQSNYSGTNFGNITKQEIEDFIKRQRFVSAVNTNKFTYLQHDTHVNGDKLPYLWAMFVSDLKLGEQHFRTYLLKYYFFNKNIIVELDFLMPEEEMKTVEPTINKILDSVKFKQLY